MNLAYTNVTNCRNFHIVNWGFSWNFVLNLIFSAVVCEKPTKKRWYTYIIKKRYSLWNLSQIYWDFAEVLCENSFVGLVLTKNASRRGCGCTYHQKTLQFLKIVAQLYGALAENLSNISPFVFFLSKKTHKLRWCTYHKKCVTICKNSCSFIRGIAEILSENSPFLQFWIENNQRKVHIM